MTDRARKLIKAQIADSIRKPTEKQILALLKCLGAFGLSEDEVNEVGELFAKGVADTLSQITDKISIDGENTEVSRIKKAFSKALDIADADEKSQ